MVNSSITLDDYAAIAPLFGFVDADGIRDFVVDQQRKADSRSSAEVRRHERALRV